MDFGLSQDQLLFQQALRGYLAEHVPIARVRAVMESESGTDPELREALAAQGVCGILVPEAHGGAGLSLLDAVVAAEELGSAATPLSFHASCVMAPLAIAAAGSPEQQQRWLPAIASGRATVSFVNGARAARSGKLDGNVRFVPDAHVADAFVVQSGEELLLVPRDSPGIEVVRMGTVDETRPIGELLFRGLRVEPSMRMTAGQPAAVAGRAIDAGRIALAADALGASSRALSEAVAYSLERRQFGRQIGSFQAVKHMCAEMAATIEPLRSLLWYVAFAWDTAREDAPAVAALAKSHAAEVSTRATTTAIEVFGGMGFTHECDVHLWFKRAGYDRQMLGGPAELRARAADLSLSATAASARR